MNPLEPQSSSQLDVVAEYDYFADQKKQLVLKQTIEKRKLDAQRRSHDREIALQWRNGGKTALAAVQSRVAQIRCLLKPHHFLRLSLDTLHQYAQERDSILRLRSRHHQLHNNSYLLLYAHRVSVKPRHYLMKTNLIELKAQLIQEIKYSFRQSHPLAAEELVSGSNVANLTLFRFILRYFLQFIPIPFDMRKLLSKKRDHHRTVLAKLALIQRTQAACEFISKCKSRQHYNVKGCSNCGVIFFGGSLTGAVPYVKSISRDTGVATLVTLEFEVETLQKEEEIQLAIVEKSTLDLEAYELIVYDLVRAGIQPWWSIVLAYKRALKVHVRLQRSKARFRIRRLVRLKNELDIVIKEPAPLPLQSLTERYYDVKAELFEYAEVITERKRLRILAIAQRMRGILHHMVDEGRERRYQEWLRQQDLLKRLPPIKIKTLSHDNGNKKWICYRRHCNHRHFLSEDRYQTHMSLHYQEDEERLLLLQQHMISKARREKASENFLARLHVAREYIQQEYTHLQSLHNIQDEEEASLEVVKEASILQHSFHLLTQLCMPTFTLELVSKNSSVHGQGSYQLDSRVTCIGTNAEKCGLCVSLPGPQIDGVHCQIVMSEQLVNDQMTLSAKVIDNSSKYGTYVVGIQGAKKVHKEVNRGAALHNGSLLCLGVIEEGPAELSVSDASLACLVYKFVIS